MAQLKSSIVTGSLRVTDAVITDIVQASTVKVPTTSGGTTYGAGTSGQVLKTNGTTAYWGDDTSVSPSSTTPLMDGTAAVGTGTTYARADHRHPTDTSRAPLASPALTGTPTAPTATAGTNTTQVATTAFVKTAVDDAVGAILSITIPSSAWSNREATVTCTGVTPTSNILVTSDPSTMEAATGAGVFCSAQGTNTLTFTCMGVEPTEDLIMDVWIGRFLVDSTSYAPISSPTFTGTPTAPTAAAGTNSTQIATTAFVMSAIGSSGLTPSSSDPIMDGTASPGTSLEYSRGDHVHPTDTSRAASTHVHGNITNTGTVTASGVAIANNDTLLIVDASDSSKIKQTSIKFDGSTATKALTQKGTFETFLTSHQSLSAYAPLASPAFTGTPTAPTANAGTSTTQLATTAFVQNAISSVSGAMYFMGSLGTGGTITTLPAASAANKGYAYKVITAGTYQSVAAKVGDMLISDGTAWVLIPSGDEPSGTVTSITLKAGNGISLDVDNTAITTSGTRTITNSGVRSIDTGSTNGTISVNTNGSSAEVAVKGLGTAAYTASGDYATSSHTHGNITNAGAITATGVALANGDSLVFVDSSDSSKIKKTSITFDGSTATQALTKKGTFETFLTQHQDLSAYAPLASPALTGTPTAPTAASGTNTTQIATTAFVKAAVDAKTVPVATTTTPKMDGTAAVGSETKWAKGDHVHPTDTSRAPLASPALTGTPTAPTATAGTSSTQIATTAFVGTAVTNAKPTATSVSVATSAWNNLTATVNVTGVTTSNNVLVSPDPASRDYAVKAQMYCSAQGAGTLTFKCKTVPTNAVTVNVMIFS